jgi:O-antigen/teichoic acid export membrane protein
VIPFTLAIPMFPVLSRLASTSRQAAFRAFLRALRIFVLLGMPVGAWLVVLGERLMPLLFGQAYVEASGVLRFGGVVVLFLFMNAMFVYLFTALHRERHYMYSVGVSAGLNFILDLILIPPFGFMGAAAAAVVAEIGMFVTATVFLARMGLVIDYLQLLARPFIAALAAALVLLWSAQSGGLVSVVVGTLAFGACYLVLAQRTGAFSISELKELRGVMKP